MHNQGKQLGDGSLAVSCLHDVDYDFKIGMEEGKYVKNSGYGDATSLNIVRIKGNRIL